MCVCVCLCLCVCLLFTCDVTAETTSWNTWFQDREEEQDTGPGSCTPAGEKPFGVPGVFGLGGVFLPVFMELMRIYGVEFGCFGCKYFFQTATFYSMGSFVIGGLL